MKSKDNSEINKEKENSLTKKEKRERLNFILFGILILFTITLPLLIISLI